MNDRPTVSQVSGAPCSAVQARTGTEPAVVDPGKQALAISLELSKNAVRARTLDDLQFILVNDTRSLLPFDRSLLIAHMDGKSRLVATNNQPSVERKSDFVKRVNDLAQSLKTVERALILLGNAPKAEGVDEAAESALKDYIEYAECSCLIVIPLSSYDHIIGHLLLEFIDNKPPGQVETLALMNMVPFLSTAFAEKWVLAENRSAKASFFDSVAGPGRRQRMRKSALRIGLLIALIAAVALAMITPMSLKVGGESEIAPEYEYFSFVEMDGIVKKVLVKQGDLVKKGQLLATLDDEELSYKIREAERLLKSYETEAEILRNMAAEDPKKLAESQLTLIKARRAALQLDFLNWQKRFLEVRSPTDGLVITERVETLIGKRFKAGEAFCRISPQDVLLLDIFVKESDIVFVKPGQKAEAFFNFRPDESHPLTVKKIAPRAEAKPDLGNIFTVEAAFESRPPNIKPGMKGIARITTEQAPVWFVVTRRLRTKINEILMWF